MFDRSEKPEIEFSDTELKYFFEWGHSGWVKGFSKGLQQLGGLSAIRDKQVLEIGTRNGKMACLFALMGAQRVIAIDLEGVDLNIAAKEAEKHAVSEKVEFRTYNGDLSSLNLTGIDFVFTKSVLVVVSDREKMCDDINNLLSNNGRFLFLENQKGGLLLRLIRQARHRNWNWKEASFLDSDQLKKFKRSLDVEHIVKIFLPPLYVLSGKKLTKQVDPA